VLVFLRVFASLFLKRDRASIKKNELDVMVQLRKDLIFILPITSRTFGYNGGLEKSIAVTMAVTIIMITHFFAQ
jgi:hypothetical protein